MIQLHTYPAGHETLSGITYKAADNHTPKLIFLHGAGTGNKDRRTYMFKILQEMGVSTFAFDFSGHGMSSGELSTSSLKKRLNEARISIENHMDTSAGISICAQSMGAHIALELLPYFKIQSFFLMAPAAYGKEAFNVQFNQGFTDIIRKPESWKSAETMPLLRRFTGNLLLYLGENDHVIPSGVIDMITENAANTSFFKTTVLPGAPHELNGWIEKEHEWSVKIATEMARYI